MLDPFFMHPYDNLDHSIVTLPLTNQNYHTWFRSIRVALVSKNKLRFIDETLIRPSTMNENPWHGTIVTPW